MPIAFPLLLIKNSKFGCRKLLSEIKKRRSQLFLDLKLHDIPNTVSNAINSLSKINPEYMTLHISGGKTMLEQSLMAVKKLKLKTTKLHQIYHQEFMN